MDIKDIKKQYLAYTEAKKIVDENKKIMEANKKWSNHLSRYLTEAGHPQKTLKKKIAGDGGYETAWDWEDYHRLSGEYFEGKITKKQWEDGMQEYTETFKKLANGER